MNWSKGRAEARWASQAAESPHYVMDDQRHRYRPASSPAASAAMLIAALALQTATGCAFGPDAESASPVGEFESTVTVEYGPPSPADPATPPAYQQLDQAVALARGQTHADAPARSDASVQWLSLDRPLTLDNARQTKPAPPAETDTSPPREPRAQPDLTPRSQADTAKSPAPTPTALTRRELLDRLQDELRATHTPAMRQALQAVVVSALAEACGGGGPEPGPIDPRFLEPLTDSQRDAILRYQQLLHELQQALAATDADGVPLPGDLLDRHLGEVRTDAPVRLARLELCTRVDGYGVFEPFDRLVFRAGQAQPAIVYVEVEDFEVEPDRQTPEWNRVRLRQEVMLFNEADGLVVWRQEPVDVTDRSRNHRRDFFIVQMITLPANLSVGRYRLGVRVTDLLDGSQDEARLPLRIVADPTLSRP